MRQQNNTPQRDKAGMTTVEYTIIMLVILLTAAVIWAQFSVPAQRPVSDTTDAFDTATDTGAGGGKGKGKGKGKGHGQAYHDAPTQLSDLYSPACLPVSSRSGIAVAFAVSRGQSWLAVGARSAAGHYRPNAVVL